MSNSPGAARRLVLLRQRIATELTHKDANPFKLPFSAYCFITFLHIVIVTVVTNTFHNASWILIGLSGDIYINISNNNNNNSTKPHALSLRLA